MKSSIRKAVERKDVEAALAEPLLEAGKLSIREQLPCRPIRQAKSDAEVGVRRDDLLEGQRVLVEVIVDFRPRLAGMDVGAVGEMEEAVLVDPQGYVFPDSGWIFGELQVPKACDSSPVESLIDLVDFNSSSNLFKEHDRQLTSKMLSERFETMEDAARMFRIGQVRFELGHVEHEAETAEERHDPTPAFLCEHAREIGIRAVERDADPDGFAMAYSIVGKLLELVRCPVAEIERTRAAHLEGIA